MSLCAVDADAAVHPCGSGVIQYTDVSPRRLQQFVVQPDATYLWRNRRVVDDSLVASGSVLADAEGIVTVSAFEVAPDGNRLTLLPAGQDSSVMVATDVAGQGQVSHTPADPFELGQRVSLTAKADTGWRFDHWAGDLTGVQATQTVILTGDLQTTATFVLADRAVYLPIIMVP